MTEVQMPPRSPARAEMLLSAGPLATLGCLAALVIGCLLLPESVRWIVAPLALVLPGHALVLAIGEDLSLDPAPAAALRVVSSLAVYVLITVIAGGLGLTLTDAAILGAVTFVTAVLAAVGWARTTRPAHRAPAGATARDAVDAPDASRGDRTGLHHPVIVLVVALALGLAVLVGGHAMATDPDEPEFTELSLAGDQATAVTPVAVEDGRAALRVRVGNGSERSRAYVVSAGVDGPSGWGAARVAVPAGDARTVRLAGRVTAPGCPGVLVVRVVPSGGTEPIARLTLPYEGEAGEDCTAASVTR